MGLGEAIPILKLLTPLASAVPVAGPVLEGLLDVAIQVCEAAEVRHTWKQISFVSTDTYNEYIHML